MGEYQSRQRLIQASMDIVKGIYDRISLIYLIIKILLINSDSVTTESTDPEVYNKSEQPPMQREPI